MSKAWSFCSMRAAGFLDFQNIYDLLMFGQPLLGS